MINIAKIKATNTAQGNKETTTSKPNKAVLKNVRITTAAT